jgi:hypothetical protein
MKIKMLKGLALGVLIATVASTGYSQGEINFFTFNSGNAARGNIFLNNGTTPAGATLDAQLWGSLTSATTGFTALSTIVTLSGGIANDATPAQDNTDTFASGGGGTSDAGNFEWYQVRVWNASAGGSWNVLGLTWVGGGAGSVVNSGSDALLTLYGVTAMAGTQTRVILGGTSTDGNNNLFSIPQSNNFNNLTLTATPEPTTLALAGLGGAALLAFRRKKA